MPRNNLDLFEDAQNSAPAAREVETDTVVTKCPSCGANMEYSSEKGKLYCKYCGTEKVIISRTSEEQDFERLLESNNAWGNESHVFRCENCGAREILDKRDIAKTCPFCGTSNIVETDELPGVKPNAVVPFRIGKEEAVGKMKKWINKRIFAPREFRKSAKPEKLEGVYTPAFSFDTVTESDYHAVLGEHHYRTRHINGKPVQEQYTTYFTVSGHYTMAFDDVLVQASETISKKSLNKLQPFDTNNSQEYTQEYLSGFTATQYTKSGTACWEEAKGVIRDRLKSAVLSQYTYDVVSSFNITTQCHNITYKYILLPIYVGHFNWHAKLYNFFISGFNGKITGKAPVSVLKVFGIIFISLVVLSCLSYLYQLLGG